MTSLRLPNINALDTAGQVKQIRSYLFQLYEHLKITEQSITENKSGTAVYKSALTGSGAKKTEIFGSDFEKTKALIIASADIVNAYYEKISRRLRSQYVSRSDFGTYIEDIEGRYEAAASSLTAKYDEIQKIVGDNGDGTVKLSAYVRAGKIEEGTYGIEVGQTSDDSFKRFARFTAGGLYFYDGNNDDPAAWIENYILHIRSAEIGGNLVLGKYKYDTSDGIIHQWIGG